MLFIINKYTSIYTSKFYVGRIKQKLRKQETRRNELKRKKQIGT